MSDGEPRLLMIANLEGGSGAAESGLWDTGTAAGRVVELAKGLGRFGWGVDVYALRRLCDRETPTCSGTAMDLGKALADKPPVPPFDGRRSGPVTRGVRVFRFDYEGAATDGHWFDGGLSSGWMELFCRLVADTDALPQAIMSHGRDSGAAVMAMAKRFKAFHLHMPGPTIGRTGHEATSIEEGSLEVDRRVLSACDIVLAESPVMARTLTGVFAVPSGKVRMCPPGFDDSRFFPVSPATREAIKERLGLSGRVVYSCGLPGPGGGFASLVRAMPVVLARVEDARLVLGVDRPSGSRSQQSEAAALRELAERLGVVDRVVSTPYPDPKELPDHYRAADVFALCERGGAYDVHAVEAMACGTPTVVDGASGTGEQVAWGLEALTADAGDAEAFGHAIAAVLQHDRLASQLGRCGAERARAEFTWTGVAQGVIQVVEEWRGGAVKAGEGEGAQRLRGIPALAGV